MNWGFRVTGRRNCLGPSENLEETESRILKNLSFLQIEKELFLQTIVLVPIL